MDPLNEPAQPGPTVVAVAGSCASRDNFNSRLNPHYRDYFACPLHQNQTSMIALMAPALDVRWTPLGPMSDYDRWNVSTEFSRSFLTEVTALQPRYLILDFFADIHFGCIREIGDAGSPGSWVTNNRWKIHQTDWYQKLQEADRLESISILEDPAPYLVEWEAAFERFAQFATTELPDTTLVVHQAPNVKNIRLPDRPLPAPLRENAPISWLNIRQANELWRRLDEVAIAISGAETIDLTDREWCTVPDHPWGPFYVHYDMAYYHRFLAELIRIDSVPRWGDPVGSAVETVAASYAEEIELFEEEHDRRLDRLRGRITRLRDRLDAAATSAPDPSRRTGSALPRALRKRLRRG